MPRSGETVPTNHQNDLNAQQCSSALVQHKIFKSVRKGSRGNQRKPLVMATAHQGREVYTVQPVPTTATAKIANKKTVRLPSRPSHSLQPVPTPQYWQAARLAYTTSMSRLDARAHLENICLSAMPPRLELIGGAFGEVRPVTHGHSAAPTPPIRAPRVCTPAAAEGSTRCPVCCKAVHD